MGATVIGAGGGGATGAGAMGATGMAGGCLTAMVWDNAFISTVS